MTPRAKKKPLIGLFVGFMLGVFTGGVAFGLTLPLEYLLHHFITEPLSAQGGFFGDFLNSPWGAVFAADFILAAAVGAMGFSLIFAAAISTWWEGKHHHSKKQGGKK